MSARPDSDFNPASNPECSECQRFLRLALAQPMRAEQEFIAWLDATLQTPPEQAILFELLEQIRSALCFVREAVARRYLEMAPHFDSETATHFQRGIEATRRMMRSYTFCARLDTPDELARLAKSPDQARYLATVLHRCLHYSGMLIFEHYRAKLELPAGIWTQHNALFATANRLGVATLPIDDQIFDEVRASHCLAAYVTPLLVEQAAPYGRSPRELHLIWHWAEKAAHKVELRPLAPTASGAAYGIVLEQDAPLRPLPLIKGHPGIHQLETSSITGRMRRILEELARGIAPERLGLCLDNVEQSKELLEYLAAQWSLEGAQRRHETRRGGKGLVAVCSGLPAMHHSILGSDPNPAGKAQLKRLEPVELSYPKEKWEIIDRSPEGLRLACEATAYKLVTRQLVALSPDDCPGYVLGQVAWLKREQSGRLIAGIALLPGQPQAVCIRPLSTVRGEKSTFLRALLLRPGPDAPDGSTLVLPVGLPGNFTEVEVLYDRYWRLALDELLQRGLDFLRYSFRAA